MHAFLVVLAASIGDPCKGGPSREWYTIRQNPPTNLEEASAMTGGITTTVVTTWSSIGTRTANAVRSSGDVRRDIVVKPGHG